MFQGFYRAASGMLTQTRSLNVISNNMANATTPGFKSDRLIISDFQQELLSRTGNKDKSGRTVIGEKSMLTGGAGTVTDFSQGSLSRTSDSLDFALKGQGFFCIQTQDGTVYTRNGDFALDGEGYLVLPGSGRVLGTDGPIRLGTDRITAGGDGTLYTEDGVRLGRLMVVDFQDYGVLEKGQGDTFTAGGNAQITDVPIEWQSLESSNAQPVEQMTRMMAGQRALQSSAQVMKMYDQLISRMTELGPAG